LSKLRKTTPLIALAALFALLTACTTQDRPGNGDFEFRPYSSTAATAVGGKAVMFDELDALEDRPIVLNFWAGNCPPCRAEMPAFEQTWRKYSDEVLFLGVDVGPYVGLGSYESGRNLIEELGITYPTGNTPTRQVVTDWELRSMPSTFFLNSDGSVHDITIGAITASRVDAKVQELIAANSG
jgi:thiol-disulfide isomerase/thioredoxin